MGREGLYPPFFCAFSLGCRHPGAPAVVGIIRMFCYRQGVFYLVECGRNEAKKRRIELSQEGWVVAHTEVL